MIYQDYPNNNVVFVGYDNNKNARYAMCRGTNESRYMKEATGSHKAFSFRLEALEKQIKYTYLKVLLIYFLMLL